MLSIGHELIHTSIGWGVFLRQTEVITYQVSFHIPYPKCILAKLDLNLVVTCQKMVQIKFFDNGRRVLLLNGDLHYLLTTF